MSKSICVARHLQAVSISDIIGYVRPFMPNVRHLSWQMSGKGNKNPKDKPPKHPGKGKDKNKEKEKEQDMGTAGPAPADTVPPAPVVPSESEEQLQAEKAKHSRETLLDVWGDKKITFHGLQKAMDLSGEEVVGKMEKMPNKNRRVSEFMAEQARGSLELKTTIFSMKPRVEDEEANSAAETLGLDKQYNELASCIEGEVNRKFKRDMIQVCEQVCAISGDTS